jgi:hypothetical protein
MVSLLLLDFFYCMLLLSQLLMGFFCFYCPTAVAFVIPLNAVFAVGGFLAVPCVPALADVASFARPLFSSFFVSVISYVRAVNVSLLLLLCLFCCWRPCCYLCFFCCSCLCCAYVTSVWSHPCCFSCLLGCLCLCCCSCRFYYSLPFCYLCLLHVSYVA